MSLLAPAIIYRICTESTYGMGTSLISAWKGSPKTVTSFIVFDILKDMRLNWLIGGL